MLKNKIICIKTEAIKKSIRKLTFTRPTSSDGNLSTISAGKNVSLSFSHYERSYTVVASDNDTFSIIVKDTERFGASTYLCKELVKDNSISINACYGGVEQFGELAGKSITVAVGGIGITFALALIEHIEKEHINCSLALLISDSMIENIPYFDHLVELARERNWLSIEFFITKEIVRRKENMFHQRRIISDDIKEADIFVVCGSYNFSEGISKIIKSNKKTNVFVEAYSSSTKSSSFKECGGKVNVNNEVNFHFEKNATFLELFEKNNIPIKSQCRTGICGSCRIQIIKGDTEILPDFCLSDTEKEQGFRLACCSMPKSGDITLLTNC